MILASHGFVVAAPDHTGDTIAEFYKSKGSQDPLSDPLSAPGLAKDPGLQQFPEVWSGVEVW